MLQQVRIAEEYVSRPRLGYVRVINVLVHVRLRDAPPLTTYHCPRLRSRHERQQGHHGKEPEQNDMCFYKSHGLHTHTLFGQKPVAHAGAQIRKQVF